MKSKNPKIQILKKGMAIILSAMFLVTPITYAATSLDDSYLQSSWWEQILYGTVGSTAKEIEEYFNSGRTTLYIQDETQLRALAEYVNNGNDCLRKEIILLSDIKLDSSNEWIPIGNEQKPFNGVFNGNNYTISGLTYLRENKSYEDLNNIGLFGVVESNGIIKNIISENFNIDISYEQSDLSTTSATQFLYRNAGNTVGKLMGGTIENCINKSNISGASCVGGIVGFSDDGKINNCINYGNIQGYNYTGGIVGASSDKINNCINEGNISSLWMAGGIAGVSADNINNSINRGKISGSTYIGGILGARSQNIEGKVRTITNCTNYGNVEGTNGYIGGIQGYGYYTNEILNCINEGNVSGSNFFGGILGSSGKGESEDNTTIKNCINEGNITGTGEDGSIAGIQGRSFSEKQTIINCINKGNISGTKYVAGILTNAMNDAELIIKDCSNIGEINGTSYIGGIIANVPPVEGKIENCINEGEVSGDEYAGEIYGNKHQSSNCKIITDPSDSGFDAQDLVIGATEQVYTSDVKVSFGATNVTYAITKNGENISEDTYLKIGDVIKVTATFDKYLAKLYGPLTAITEAPTLKINNSIEMTPGNINVSTSNYTTTIEYTYTVQEGDNFNIKTLNLSKTGTIYAVGSDYSTNHPTINVSSVSANVGTTIVDTKKPTINTKIYVENLLETGRYTAGKEILFEVTTSERINGIYETPQIQVSFSESGVGKYNYTEETGKAGYAKCKSAQINLDGTTTWIYSYQVQEFDEGNVQIEYKEGKVTDLAGNATTLLGTKESSKIYADTTAPTVTITADKSNPTNSSLITYTITWSEKVKGFTKEDITVINGEIKSELEITGTIYEKINQYGDCDKNGKIEEADAVYLLQYLSMPEDFPLKEEELNYDFNEDGIVDDEDASILLEYVKGELTTYEIDVQPNISKGNTGEVKVILEEGVCTDLVGINNVREENIIVIDKIAPIFISLEAYVQSNISLNKDVDTVKEYYKAGDIVEIVATFSENIEATTTVPELALQFSESGNAKGTIAEKDIVKSANKITYKYVITNKDKGTLSVKGFVGTVKDAAGNETAVAKKVLDGNTIIADTDAPSLNELNIVSPTTGKYKAGKTIEIHAIYDENVYALTLKDNEIKDITSETAPVLKVKFADGEEREATFRGYVGEDKTKLKYTISILDGENGLLSITSYTNKENVIVCDIAGNESSLGVNPTGNEITADTKRPEVENITTVVENPSILGTDIYHKEGNKIKITLTFSEEVSSNAVLWPKILVGFSEQKGKEPTKYNEYAYESDWNVNSKTIEYLYTIRNGEDGYLWVKVPEGEFKDIAGNTNVAKTAEEESNVFADTTIPTVTLYRDTEEQQNKQVIKIIATFNENVYDLKGNNREILTKENAPKLIYSFGEGANNQTEDYEASVNGDTITYTITKHPVEDNGDLHYELAKGNLCDRAGNELYTTTLDTTAPVLQSVAITSNAEIYNHYCKEGKEIYVIATFNEPIKAENMKLKAKIGEVELTQLLDGEIVEENNTMIKFTYTVKSGDKGVFKILAICGETDVKITEENADKTYGWVRDEHENQNNIYSLLDEGVTPTGRAEADTKGPYIASIKAKVDGKEIATYTREDGKEAIINVGRTNANIVEYIVTYSEKVQNIDKSKISITNGIIKDIQYTDSLVRDEYKITVQTTVEGVQSLIILDDTIEDKAGNTDEFVRLNVVTVDFTKPTVRFISEYNGGVYVLPTNIDKVEIRPNVEISEDITTIEYKWSKVNDKGEWIEDITEYKTIDNYSSSSDIAVPTKVFTVEGNYQLSIKVVDLAGNDRVASKVYKIAKQNITISTDVTEYTNEPITVTVSFGDNLTDNRKVIFKPEGSNEIIELNAIGTDKEGNTQYSITENGTVYAEATDRVGNKVFTSDNKDNESLPLKIENIDTEKPEITIELNGANLVIGTDKDKATIKTNVKTTDNNWVESAKYAFLAEDIDINNITAEEKTKIANNLEYEAKIENALSTKDKKPYYLYVIAIDAAGNETIAKSEAFTVVDTNPGKVITTVEGENGPEEKVETIPAEKPVEQLIIFNDLEKNGEEIKDKEYIGVDYDDTIITESKITIDNEGYGHKYEEDAVEIYGATTITVEAWDACGNKVERKYEVKKEDIIGPEFTISGNPEGWTNSDVELEVYSNAQLKALTLNGENILGDNKYRVNKVIEGYGIYTFEATDIYGNTSEQTIEVRIDKADPEITDVKIEDGKIVITANDIDKTLNKELSGLAEYAITDTTEVPVEWSKSNVINVTKDTNFFVWAKDNAGNITMKEEIVVRDITAPELTITTDAKLDKWTNTDIKVDVKSNEELSSLVVKYIENEEEKEVDILNTKTYTITSNGTYEIVAKDKVGNETKENVVVTKIDKIAPEISENDTTVNGRDITIEATDDLSEIEGYAVTITTEEPVEWSKSNVVKVTEDGTFYVWVKDNAGNITMSEEPIVVDTVALEIEVTGNTTDWTNEGVELTVKANKELSALKMISTETNVDAETGKETTEHPETEISLLNPKVVIPENGEYRFVATDKNGKTDTETVEVTTIDKVAPQIPDNGITVNGRDITITATDNEGGAGIAGYAVTSTTEVPVEWSASNVIKVTEDGVFYVWVKDNAGNITRAENIIVVDTTAPIITLNYLSQTITVGMPLEAYILTDENATISYSWDNENWVDSQEKLTSLKVSEKSTTIGKATLYVKATDEAGNESEVQTLEFNVVNIEEIKEPAIIFEDIPTVQINGVRYVKVSSNMTAELLTDKMNKEALCGKTPEYTKLTEDNKLKTGSEIAINGSTKYVIVVNGDVNGDGKVTFLGDVVMANNYRIGQVKLTTMQMLAADINNSGNIEFIPDIIAMNNYRLGIINSL